MKFYCTKYWATKGIIEFDGDERDGGYASQRPHKQIGFFLKIGKDAFTDLEEAKNNVEHKAHLNLHAKERAFRAAKTLLLQAADRKIRVVK
jgi:hypothetical protein